MDTESDTRVSVIVFYFYRNKPVFKVHMHIYFNSLFEKVIKSRWKICIMTASNNLMRYKGKKDIFGTSSSGKLLFKSKFVSLFHNFGNEYQSRPHKQGW